MELFYIFKMCIITCEAIFANNSVVQSVFVINVVCENGRYVDTMSNVFTVMF